MMCLSFALCLGLLIILFGLADGSFVSSLFSWIELMTIVVSIYYSTRQRRFEGDNTKTIGQMKVADRLFR